LNREATAYWIPAFAGMTTVWRLKMPSSLQAQSVARMSEATSGDTRDPGYRLAHLRYKIPQQ